MSNAQLDDFDRKELFNLLRESVKSSTLNAEATKTLSEVQKSMNINLCGLNDNFILHRNATEQNISLIKNDLIKWVKYSILVIFTLLGGIVIAEALGLDIVDIIKGIGN